MIDIINTKIIATVGPSSRDKNVLEKLYDAGARAFRLNFSHGDYDHYENIVNNIREIEKEKSCDIPIIQDLQGPKIRLNAFKDKVFLNDGDSFCLSVCSDPLCSIDKVCIVYPDLISEIKVGELIKIDDGSIELEVIDVKGSIIHTKVSAGGELKPRKGVNFPGTKLSLPTLTEKDIKDLKYGVELKFDFVALSFVRSANDVLKVKQILEYEGSNAELISKIEKPEALCEIEQIVDVSDIILIARGDLGVEINLEKVPGIQKNIIKLCREKKVPVIVATQMLETMIESYTPTRAEVTDVYTAVEDGADVLMLSGETAMGKHPELVVKTMRKIIKEAEKSLYQDISSINDAESVDETLAIMSSVLTNKVNASFICVFTTTGWTAKLLSKTNNNHPIIAFTPHKEIKRKISLYQGVIAIDIEKIFNLDKLFDLVDKELKSKNLAQAGEKVVVVTGQPFGKAGSTNIIKVHTIN